jgi:prepilin-type N-terminal cleavage/methylation domain-containing protein
LKLSSKNGFSLTELLITLAIFSLAMGSIFSVYSALVKHTTRQYCIAESDSELTIVKDIISRDIMMAGYGIADDYGNLNYDPRPIELINESAKNDFDILTLRGTAIGIFSRASQAWSYVENANFLKLYKWNDARENINKNDIVIFIEPVSRKLIDSDGKAVFKYPKESPSSYEDGTLVYGIHSEDAKIPYYSVQYLLGGTSPSRCAPGTYSLLRAESKDSDPPPPSVRRPLLSCVKDFQVAIGLDEDDDGIIDHWEPENGEIISNKYDTKTLKQRIKQIKVYLLVQKGNYDSGYVYKNPDEPDSPWKIYVGEKLNNSGRYVTLRSEQKNYNWRLISFSVTPRNL